MNNNMKQKGPAESKQVHKANSKAVVQEAIQKAMRETADVKHTVEDRFHNTAIELGRQILDQKNPSSEVLVCLANILGYGNSLLLANYKPTQKRIDQRYKALKKAIFAMTNPDHVQPSKKMKL
jgi:hypothetical protein